MNGNIIVAISGSLNAEVLISITPKAINMKKIVKIGYQSVGDFLKLRKTI